MVAFYLKGVAPKHVTLNQIFLGMLPFMAIQILAIVLLYQFPAIGMCRHSCSTNKTDEKKEAVAPLFCAFVNQRISARRPGSLRTAGRRAAWRLLREPRSHRFPAS
jgi:hypothetical protein